MAQLWVYGSISPHVDGAPPVIADFAITPYDTPGQPVSTGTYIAPNVTEQQFNVLFWESGLFTWQGAHFTMNVTSASVDTPFLFDYLIYTEQTKAPPPPVLPTTTTLSNALPLSTGTAPSSPSSSAALPGQSGEPQAAQASGSNNHTGVIAGGVVGGVVLIAAIMALLLFWCRERRSVVKDTPSMRGAYFTWS